MKETLINIEGKSDIITCENGKKNKRNINHR